MNTPTGEANLAVVTIAAISGEAVPGGGSCAAGDLRRAHRRRGARHGPGGALR